MDAHTGLLQRNHVNHAFGRSRTALPRIVCQCSSPRRPASNHAPTLPQLRAAAVACVAAVLYGPGAAWAGTSKIGEFEASGFLFKDAVEVNAFDDPAVPGVTIYFSDFKRSLVDKLAKDFFTDPSQTSLTCSISEDAHVADPRALASSEGKEIFSERKGLSIFKDKTLRVRRLYDPSRQTLVYVAYSTRLSSAADEGKVSSGRYRTSICALKLPSPAAKAPAVTDAVSAAAALN